MTNAELMFIMSKGSPIRGVPAREVIEPAIIEYKESIAPELVEGSLHNFARQAR
jgi:hypothetical protein